MLKQLTSRDELISLHGDAQSDMVAQTRDQMNKVRERGMVEVYLKESFDADKAKQAAQPKSSTPYKPAKQEEPKPAQKSLQTK